MNVIIVAIIALVVLVVVAAFFLGGFTNIAEKIASIFRGGVSDTDTAIISCGNLCSSAETLPTDIAKKNSGYCQNFFYLDVKPRDGKVDRDSTTEKKVRYYCWTPTGEIETAPTGQVPGVEPCDLQPTTCQPS